MGYTDAIAILTDIAVKKLALHHHGMVRIAGEVGAGSRERILKLPVIKIIPQICNAKKLVRTFFVSLTVIPRNEESH